MINCQHHFTGPGMVAVIFEQIESLEPWYTDDRRGGESATGDVGGRFENAGIGCDKARLIRMGEYGLFRM